MNELNWGLSTFGACEAHHRGVWWRDGESKHHPPPHLHHLYYLHHQHHRYHTIVTAHIASPPSHLPSHTFPLTPYRVLLHPLDLFDLIIRQVHTVIGDQDTHHTRRGPLDLCRQPLYFRQCHLVWCGGSIESQIESVVVYIRLLYHHY